MRQICEEHIRKSPKLSDDWQSIVRDTKDFKNSSEIWEKAASQYSGVRINPSLFAHYHAVSEVIDIASSSGFLNNGKLEFMADVPSHLMGRAIVTGESIHVPEIKGVDKRSMLEQYAESGGTKVFSDQKVPIEAVNDETLSPESCTPRWINSLIPNGFSPEEGTLLLTPLNVGQVLPMALGFVLEYKREGGFSFSAIQDARAYAALFTQLIVEKMV